MKKIIIVFLIIGLLIAVGWAGVYSYNKTKNNKPSPQNTNKTISLTNSNDGEKISLQKDDKLKITLRDPGDGGYVFSEPQYDKSILKQIDYKDIKSSSEKMGDFGSDEWTFEAIKSGNTTLRYNIYRSWKPEEQIKDFEITVNVN